MRDYFQQIFRSIKSIWLGLAVTMRTMGKRTVTLQYPDVIPPIAPRYRGFHEYEIERCIACGLCTKACPVDCIDLGVAGKGKTAVVTHYRIDYGKCLLCGLCTEPCPTSCVHMGKVHDISGYTRTETIVDFAELARQGRRTPEARWMAKARENPKRVPDWIMKVNERYKPTDPIVWGEVGNVKRGK